MDNLQEAYLSVYQELDEVTGRGRIDPVSDFPHHGERGSRTPKESGLKMSPLDRAEARANALKKRGDSEATKRANRIQSRFVGPTKRGLVRAIDASNVARRNEKDRLLNREEFDLFDYLLEYLVAEGYANTNENAIAIMANMSDDWREEIIDEAEKVFPLRKVADKTNQLRQRIKDSKSPEEQEKLRKRMNKMDDEYWQPN